uniref:Uncharacterized protein n=1 Tax=Setaria viridis TaxID=4556 RepID=A0A4U6WMK7_SETVI|nr:hypothetical protein SEVIR_1G201400v2 [Setaria viridis]
MAMPPWGRRRACHASASSFPPALHLDSPLPLRTSPGAPPSYLHRHTAAFECEYVAAEDARGDARPPCRWGCWATAPSVDLTVGPQRRGAPPLLPSLAGPLPRVVPFLPQHRLCCCLECEDEAAGAAHGATGLPCCWSGGATRGAPCTVDLARWAGLCFSPPFFFPLPVVDHGGEEIREEGKLLGAPEIVPAGLFLLLLFFFPISFASCSHSSPLPRQHSRGRGCRCVLLGCSGNVCDQAIIAGVTAFSGGGATHAAGPHQAGSRSKSTPIAACSRTPLPMLLKEDAFALFSCTIYYRSRLIVLLNLSARSC